MKQTGKILCVIMTLIIALAGLPFCSLAADDAFEKSLSGFPESYRVPLRVLHEKYPEWVFEALDTGIDWYAAIRNECSGNRNLVPGSSIYSDIFKSKAAGDYNPSTGQYISKDSGFVSANELAVSYFMDPRNALTASGIFQFESLIFSDSCNIEAIENVLYGSFMYDTNIKYYDTSGRYISTSQKYSDAIYEAGKTYNVNTTFLASKILNEIGYSGSSSVSGTYSGYAGIYNFYNIGATDGAGAVARGLSWASSGSSYLRPWNTPYKSIMGGAKYLADNYISQEQFNGYLQKFQVNPNCSYGLYQHQYMTNVAGADTQGYTTYLSYLGSGTLGLPRYFVIPVFENMPGEAEASDTACLTESLGQTGTISNTCNVRAGPSTSYGKLDFMIPSGTRVNIIEKTRTDATYYLNVLKYPYWCKISFAYDNVNYTGWVLADYVSLTAKSVYPVGAYSFSSRVSPTTSDDTLKILSSDTSVATVSGSSVSFIKQGSVTLTAYSPCGGYDTLDVLVNNNSAPQRVVSDISAISGTDSLEITWSKAGVASGYNVCVFDSRMHPVKSYFSTANSYTAGSLSSATPYYVDVRSYTNASGIRYFGALSRQAVKCATRPERVAGCKAVEADGRVLLSWDAVKGADGYTVYRYEDGKYSLIASTAKTEYALSGVELSQAELYRVRAYVSFGANYYGAVSAAFKPDYSPLRIDKLTQTGTTVNGYTIKWNAVEGADGYDVYAQNASGKFVLVKRTAECRYVVTSLSGAEKTNYRVVGYDLTDGVYSYAEPSDIYRASTLPETPGGLTVKSSSASGVTVSWNAVSGSVYYQIMSLTPDGEYKWFATATGTQYTLKGFDGKLTCAVRAVSATDDIRLYSGCSNSVSVGLKVGAPGGFKCEPRADGFSLSWKAVAGADGYQLWRYEPDLGIYVFLLSCAENSYSVFGAQPGESHRYRLRAYMRLTNGTIYSEYSETTTL